MAGLSRSFKPSPAYLSPCRPVIPGRTLSNSSDLSLASNAADDAPDMSSTPGTLSVAPDVAEPIKNTSPVIKSPRPGTSCPTAIELPKFNKLNGAASVYTPPEPLSARGDLPGCYFPMHEDPKGRIHRTHPFHQDAAFSRHLLHQDSQTDRNDSRLSSTTAHGSMPVASYLALGFHDSPLSMGKYYPSNYEQHQREAAEAEARRKMQQHQRDMIAQAAIALGGTAKPGPGVSLGGVAYKDKRLAEPSPHKPASPRLHPLGSPGPVTPMDLEAVSAGGYLEHGKKAQDLMSNNENKMTMAAGNATRSL